MVRLGFSWGVEWNWFCYLVKNVCWGGNVCGWCGLRRCGFVKLNFWWFCIFLKWWNVDLYVFGGGRWLWYECNVYYLRGWLFG